MKISFDKLNKFSPYLLIVIIFNIHNYPFVSFLLVFLYILKNYKLIFEKNIYYNEYLSVFIKISGLIGIAGIITGMIYHNSTYELLKDAWYFVKIPFFFLFGYILFRKLNFSSVLYSFFIAGIIGIVSFIIRLLYLFITDSINFSDLTLYRWSIPDFPFELILLLIILFFFKSELNNFSSSKVIVGEVKKYFILFSILLIVILTFSRTYLISVLLIYLFYRFNNVSFRKVAVLLLFVFLVILVTSFFPSNPFIETLMTKFVSTKDELFSFGYSDKGTLYAYWRAYEVYIGLLKYTSGTVNNYLLGFGFGAMTDLQLNYPVPLGGELFYEVPTFHNGFLYSIIKTGALGLSSYLMFFFMSIRYVKKNLKDLKQERLLLISIYILCVIFFLSSFAITGLFHLYKFNTSIILFSYLLFLSRERLLLMGEKNNLLFQISLK